MEEQIKTIPILGIRRCTGLSQTDDGACDEIINLRFKDGSWRPIQPKVSVGTIPVYLHAYRHNVDSDYEAWVGHKAGSPEKIVSYINDVETEIFSLADDENFICFSHINNYLFVCTSLDKHTLVWDDNAYHKLPDLTKIELLVNDSQNVAVLLGKERSYNAALAKYLNQIQDYQKTGFYEGDVLIMAAYKLFDGTYIGHSNPYYLKLGGGAIRATHTSDIYEAERHCYDRDDDGDYFAEFCKKIYNLEMWHWDRAGLTYGCPKITMNMDAGDISELKSNYKNIIKSVDIFCTYPESSYRVWDSDPTVSVTEWHKVPVVVKLDYQNRQMTYYLIKRINLEDISSSEMTIILPSPDNFIVAETLPLDNFSNHKIIPKKNCLYNSRDHLVNVKTRIGIGQGVFVNGATTDFIRKYINVEDATYFLNYESEDGLTLKAFAYLHTDYGDKVVVYDEKTTSYWDTLNPPNRFVLIKPFPSYPDSRCYRIVFYVVKEDEPTKGSWYFTLNVTTHKLHNFSYMNSNYYYPWDGEHRIQKFCCYKFVEPSLGINYSGEPSSIFDIPLNTEDIYIEEKNRIQLSQINNPFYFPTINSYKVGNVDDVIVGISPSIAPVSENQFGQHPVFVFTKRAVYAMMTGTNEVVYSAILPVVNEEFNEESKFIPVRDGVAYTCPRGLKYIQGRNILNIDNFIREKSEALVTGDSALDTIISGTPIGEEYTLKSKLSYVGFLQFLNHAILAYDNKEDELIVANNYENDETGELFYPYCYIYNFKTNSWHKYAYGFYDFINILPGFAGLYKDGENYTIYNMSLESGTPIQTLIITRPVKLSGLGYKKITFGLLRCSLPIPDVVSQYYVLMVYGSVDGKDWEYISGKRIINTGNVVDIGINKHHISCKYFIFAWVGRVHYEGELSFIELSFTDIANNKLR